MNKRRRLVMAFGAGAVTGSFRANAQQDKVWRVGILATRNRPGLLDADAFGQFMRGMRELGYIEGKNLQVEFRWAEGKYERLSGLAAELVELKVDVIVAAGAQDIDAARKATSTIPIVMLTTSWPRARGSSQEPFTARRKYHRLREPRCRHQRQTLADAAEHRA